MMTEFMLSDKAILVMLILASVFDILSTNFTARAVRAKKPEIEYEDFELNRLQILCWKKFGVNLGSAVFGILAMALILLFYHFMPRDSVVGLIGGLLVMNMIHVANLVFILKHRKAASLEVAPSK
jgi:hypothetical protein